VRERKRSKKDERSRGDTEGLDIFSFFRRHRHTITLLKERRKWRRRASGAGGKDEKKRTTTRTTTATTTTTYNGLSRLFPLAGEKEKDFAQPRSRSKSLRSSAAARIPRQQQSRLFVHVQANAPACVRISSISPSLFSRQFTGHEL
jgi:hypothetical protein